MGGLGEKRLWTTGLFGDVRQTSTDNDNTMQDKDLQNVCSENMDRNGHVLGQKSYLYLPVLEVLLVCW